MKVLFSSLIFALILISSQLYSIQSNLIRIPKLKAWVTDWENIYSPSELQTLNSMISDFEKSTTIEIALVTISKKKLGKKDFNSFALKLANENGVGKAETDNGVLILISSELKKIRIENGIGISKVLSDEETKEIIDSSFIPNFKDGLYFDGSKAGLLKLMSILEVKFSKD